MNIYKKKFSLINLIKCPISDVVVYYCTRCGRAYTIFNSTSEGFNDFGMVNLIDISFCPICGLEKVDSES